MQSALGAHHDALLGRSYLKAFRSEIKERLKKEPRLRPALKALSAWYRQKAHRALADAEDFRKFRRSLRALAGKSGKGLPCLRP